MHDVQFTLLLLVALVVLVIYLFLRICRAAFIPSIAIPLSLAGTFAVMYLLDFSIDNLSLMALTLSVGFVVDDAIVMLENISRHMEEGETPLEAALSGSREIGFTILSMTMSLAAVFIPVLFMGGIVGRLFHEFAVTIVAAILVSGVVSLTLTPMLCSRMLSRIGLRPRTRRAGLFERVANVLRAHACAGSSRTAPALLDRVRRQFCAPPACFTFAPKGFISGRRHRPARRDDGSRAGHLVRRDVAKSSATPLAPRNPYVRAVAGNGGGQRGGSTTAGILVPLKPPGERRSADGVGKAAAGTRVDPGAQCLRAESARAANRRPLDEEPIPILAARRRLR